MSDQAISPATHKFTYSPALVSGHSPSEKQDGMTQDQSGLLAALANLSPKQAKVLGFQTSGTYGPPRSGLSSMANDPKYQFMVSKLQVLTALNGSTLYSLTWKESTTPAGTSFWLLRASVLRSSDNERTGWPAPTVSCTTGAGTQGRDGGLNLQTAAQLAGWASLATRDYKSASMGEELAAERLAHPRGKPLSEEVWTLLPGPARLTVSGELLIGSDAGMTSGGQLSPEHSLWLMGIPKEWASCAARAMQSLRKSRQRGSR